MATPITFLRNGWAVFQGLHCSRSHQWRVRIDPISPHPRQHRPFPLLPFTFYSHLSGCEVSRCEVPRTPSCALPTLVCLLGSKVYADPVPVVYFFILRLSCSSSLHILGHKALSDVRSANTFLPQALFHLS